jgi:hypothetical protein
VICAVISPRVPPSAEPDVRAVEETHERRPRHHGLEPRQLARIRALFHHGREQGRTGVEHDALGKPRDRLQDIEDDREIAIEPAADERRAACGAGDADEPADRVALPVEKVAQLPESLGVAVTIRLLEDPEIGLVERAAAKAVAPRDELSDQPAARMAHEVKLRFRRQDPGEAGEQIARVFDRTLGQRPVLQRQYSVAVDRGEVRGPCARRLPEPAEAPVRGGRGSVQKDEGGTVAIEFPRCLEIRGAGGRTPIETGARVETTFDLAADEVRHVAGDIDTEDLEAADDPLADAAALAPERQQGSDFDRVGARCVAARVKCEVALQVVDARPQAHLPIELDLQHIVGRDTVEHCRRMAFPREADAHAVLDPDLSLRKRTFEHGGLDGRSRLTLAMNRDPLHAHLDSRRRRVNSTGRETRDSKPV